MLRLIEKVTLLRGLWIGQTTQPLELSVRLAHSSSTFESPAEATPLDINDPKVKEKLLCSGVKSGLLKRNSVRRGGQPFHDTHPHLFPTARYLKKKDYLTPMVTVEEYHQRRLRLFSLMPENSIAIFPASEHSLRTNDIYMTGNMYRPDTDFYFLTGCREANQPQARRDSMTMAVFVKRQIPSCSTTQGVGERKEENIYYLFVHESNELMEKWEGAVTGVDASRKRFGPPSSSSGDSYTFDCFSSNINVVLKQIDILIRDSVLSGAKTAVQDLLHWEMEHSSRPEGSASPHAALPDGAAIPVTDPQRHATSSILNTILPAIFLTLPKQLSVSTGSGVSVIREADDDDDHINARHGTVFTLTGEGWSAMEKGALGALEVSLKDEHRELVENFGCSSFMGPDSKILVTPQYSHAFHALVDYIESFRATINFIDGIFFGDNASHQFSFNISADFDWLVRPLWVKSVSTASQQPKLLKFTKIQQYTHFPRPMRIVVRKGSITKELDTQTILLVEECVAFSTLVSSREGAETKVIFNPRRSSIRKKLVKSAHIKLMEPLRSIKSSFTDIPIMFHSAKITGAALCHAMKMTADIYFSGKNNNKYSNNLFNEQSEYLNEGHISSFIESEMKKQSGGAAGFAYVPVVANGRNALTLHYVENNDAINMHTSSEDGYDDPGTVVLVDAGCEYECYPTDCTRVWPTSSPQGSDNSELVFQPHHRRMLGTLCHCQRYGLQNIREGISIQQLHKMVSREMVRVLTAHRDSPDQTSYKGGEKLLQGLDPAIVNISTINEIFPHNIGHFIGMDLHEQVHGPPPEHIGSMVHLADVKQWNLSRGVSVYNNLFELLNPHNAPVKPLFSPSDDLKERVKCINDSRCIERSVGPTYRDTVSLEVQGQQCQGSNSATTLPLRWGMVITIEPGMYFAKELVQYSTSPNPNSASSLPDSGEFPCELVDVGMRVEDMVVILPQYIYTLSDSSEYPDAALSRGMYIRGAFHIYDQTQTNVTTDIISYSEWINNIVKEKTQNLRLFYRDQVISIYGPHLTSSEGVGSSEHYRGSNCMTTELLDLFDTTLMSLNTEFVNLILISSPEAENVYYSEFTKPQRSCNISVLYNDIVELWKLYIIHQPIAHQHWYLLDIIVITSSIPKDPHSIELVMRQ